MPSSSYYFLMTSLPTLGGLGEAPPISLAAFRSVAAEEGALAEVVDAVLLEHDLLLRQSALAGACDEIDPVVLSAEQASGEAALPEELQAEAEQGQAVGDDPVWAAYFAYVAELGRRSGVRFLNDWVGYEVALRNALVAARAKLLQLNPDEYIVAGDLGEITAEVEATVAQWASADDPLAAQRALDQGRWDWLQRHGRPFSFAGDEAAAYARALVLLDRWHQVTKAQQEQEPQA